MRTRPLIAEIHGKFCIEPGLSYAGRIAAGVRRPVVSKAFVSNEAALMSNQVDRHYYEVATPGSISEKLAVIARDKIYTDFLRFCRPSASDKILDVGVSDVVGDAANVLERRYSPQCNITAVGLGVETRSRLPFHRVQYRQVVANDALPFDDGSFDIVTSNAVLEHVGSVENQRFFISELLRVGGCVFVDRPAPIFPDRTPYRDPLPSLVRLLFHVGVPAIRQREVGHRQRI